MEDRLREKFRYLSGNKVSLLIASTAIFLSLSHFYLNWTYSGSFINHEYVGYYVEWYNDIDKHRLFSGALQFNFHIGVPFFLKPLFDIFGTSPTVIKTVASGFMAASTALLFLTYRLKYGFTRGLLTVLILFLLVFWHTFSYNEWPVVLFTVSLLLYMFVRWYENRNETLIYLIAFFSGFAFYIKWSYIHVFIGLFLSLMVVDRERIWKEFDFRKIGICAVLFLLGTSPLLITIYSTDFSHIERLTGGQSGENPFGSIVDITQNRFEDMDNRILRPVHPSLDPEFLPAGIFTLLIASGTVYSLIRGERIYTLSFLIVLALLYYTPHGLNAGQLIVLMPFIPLIIGYNLDLVPEFPFKYESVLAVTVLLIILSIPHLNPVTAIENPLHLEVNEFEEYKEAEKEDVIATNFVHPRLMAQLDQETSEIYLLGMPEHRGYRTVNPEELNNITDSSITVILADEETCQLEKHEHLKEEDPGICGYSKSDVLESENLEYLRTDEVDIGRFRYTFLR